MQGTTATRSASWHGGFLEDNVAHDITPSKGWRSLRLGRNIVAPLNGRRRYGCCHRNRRLRGSLASLRLILSPVATLSAKAPRAAGYRGSDFVLFDGFRMPGARTRPRALRRVAGVRKPPKNEPAGDGARRGRAPGYGDFANAEGARGGARCVWSRAMT